MADNVELDAGSGGAVVKTFQDGDDVHWPGGVGVYLTSEGDPDVIYVPLAAALADNMANPTTLLQGACNMVFDGTAWDRLPGTTADGVLVNLGGNNDVTVTGTVDLGATDNAVLDAISANTTGLAGTVAGSELQVDVVGALPAGSNAIGKLAANSGVDIGDVDVTSIVPGTAAANLGKAEDAAHTSGDTGVMGLGVRNDTLASRGDTDGDYVPFQMNATGALYIQEGAPLDVSASTVTVDNGGAFAVQIDAALPAGTNSIGKLGANSGVDIGDVTINNASIAVTSASALDVSAQTVTVQGTVTANLGATDNAVLDSIAAALAGTITVDGTGTFVTQSTATGNVAHDAADSGNPVKVGGKAITSEQTAVGNADRTDFVADVHGRQIVTPYCNKEQAVSGTASATDTSNTAVLAAAGAGVKNYITSISIHNSSDTDTYVTIKDGTTAKLVVAAPAKGGAVLNLSVPLASTANTAINFASAASVSTMFVSAVGFTGA